MKQTLLEALKSRRLVGDGAMGTQLMLAGLEPGASGEAWNITNPDRVLAIQRSYADFGADCLLTNTFGANQLMLRRHGHERSVAEINRCGARLAREAFRGRPGFVLGDIGPLGEIVEPYGTLSEAEAFRALQEQATSLVRARVDAIILETQTSLEEVGLGIKAAKEAGAPCIIASFAFDLLADKTSYKTSMGVSPEKAARFVEKSGADFVALNCGTGMDMAGAAMVTRIYHRACSLPVMVQPNSGMPVVEGGKTVYKQTPEEMARLVQYTLEAGASIIGSCCGSTPEHTQAIREQVRTWNQSR